MYQVPIRNRKMPKRPRVFDVFVDDTGQIISYEVQNIRGTVFVDMQDVSSQIQEYLNRIITD